MDKVDFIKEISTAFESGDMDALRKSVGTLVEYQNVVQSNIEKYTTALEVERERHKESSISLIGSIKANQTDVTNLATASSFVMGLAKSNKDVAEIVNEIVGNK